MGVKRGSGLSVTFFLLTEVALSGEGLKGMETNLAEQGTNIVTD